MPISAGMRPAITRWMAKCRTFIDDRKKHRQLLNWLVRSRAKGFRELPRRDRRKRGAPAMLYPCKARRSDGLEAMVLVMICLLYHTDIASARIGRWILDSRGRRERFVGLTATARRRRGQPRQQGDIERWTGLRPGTVENAIKGLIAIGLITSHQPVEEKRNPDGSHRFIGLAAIRKWSPKFWDALGIGGEQGEYQREARAVSEELRAERDAQKRQDEKPTRESRDVLRRVGIVSAAGPRLVGRAAVADRRAKDDRSEERARAWATMSADILAEWKAAGRALEATELRREIARRLGIRGTGPPFGT